MNVVRTNLPREEGVRRFDWEEIEGQVVLRVVGLIDPEMSATDHPDTPGGCWEIAIQTQNGWLHLTVGGDTDDLIAKYEHHQPNPNPDDGHIWVDLPALGDLIGTELGWSWSAMNSQGYWDMFVLSSKFVWPSIVFFVGGFYIETFRIADPRGIRT